MQSDDVTALPVPYSALMQLTALGVVYGNFFADNGDSLADASKWSGSLAADIAANMAGVATQNTNLDFAKLTFAVLQGWTYSSARIIKIAIKVQKLLTSVNVGNNLSLTVQQSVGNLFGNKDLDLDNGILYSSNFVSENTLNQGVTNILTSNTWSKNNMRTQIATAAVNARVFADTASPSGLSVVFAKTSDLDRTPLWRTKITGFDVDGFPNYDTPENIGNTGAPDAAASVAIPIVVPNFSSGGMPMLLRAMSSFNRGSIAANTGTAATPNYTLSLNLDLIAAGLKSPKYARTDSTGRIYLPSARFATLQYRLNRLTYNGVDNDATEFTTAGNWANEILGIAVLNTPALGGTGATAQFSSSGAAIDEDSIVNGEPTIYMTDDLNHVLFKVTRNISAFGDERDWDWVIFAGQTGIATNVDGVGVLATLNTPTGIVYDGSGSLYVNCFGARTMRKITISTANVVTFFGVDGVGAHVDQFDF